MEQNFGPHMEQKCAVLAGSCGSVASWNSRAVTGSSDRLNWSYLHRVRVRFRGLSGLGGLLRQHRVVEQPRGHRVQRQVELVVPAPGQG